MTSAKRAAQICGRLLSSRNGARSKPYAQVDAHPGRASVRDLRKVHRSPSGADVFAERREEVLHLFRTTDLSGRQIAARLGVSHWLTRQERIRYDAETRASHKEPQYCDCGKELHHPRMCWARMRDRYDGQGKVSTFSLSDADQAEIRAMLLEGLCIQTIADRFGLSYEQVQIRLKTFTPDDRGVRNAAFDAGYGQRLKPRQRPKPIPVYQKPFRDPLYARIAGAVSRGMDPVLRDDLISEAYLDVLEGRSSAKDVVSAIKRARKRLYAACADRWRMVSLDAPRNDGTGRPLIDSIPSGSTAFI